MRLFYKVVFATVLCVYLMGPSSFADAACKGSKCSRRRKSEEKQVNKEGDSMAYMSEIEANNKKSSEEESEEEGDKKEAGGKANKEGEEAAQSKAYRMRRDHELKRTHELGETRGGVYQESAKEQHRNRGANHDNHHHHRRRHVSENCHSSEGDETHQKHAQKAEPDSDAPARKRREQSPQVDLHMFDNVARHYNRRHVSDDCHSSEGEEAHKKHVNKAAGRRRRSEHIQTRRFEDPEQHGIVTPVDEAEDAEDKTLSRKPRAHDHDKKWTKRDDELYGVEDLLNSHSHSAHNRRTVMKRDSEAMSKYPYEDEIAATRHRMNFGGANTEHIHYPVGRRVGPFPGRHGRVGPFPEEYPPFVDEHTDVMVERAMSEIEKELKNHRPHKNRLD